MRTKLALVAITASLLLSAQSLAQSANGVNSNVVSELEGKVLYTRISDGSIRGEEKWHLTLHPDGARTMRMSVKLDDTQIVRDVVLRVDSSMRPLDFYQTLWSDGRHRGSGYYWVENGQMRALVNSLGGRIEQSISIPKQFSALSHALGADGWHHWYYDFQRGGAQKITVYNTDTRGQTVGSILGKPLVVDIENVGEERVTVKAGTFDTFVLLLGGQFKYWIDKPTLTMVKMTNDAGDQHYELVELLRR